MKRWHLPTLEASSDKRTAREPGADAPRVPSAGAQKPRVLFSSPECRLIALDLDAGEELADHHVRERAVVQVISGRVTIDACRRDRRMRGRNPRDVRPRRAPRTPRPRRRAATTHARALAGGRTQHGDGRTTRSTSARKRNRRADRLTRRHDDEEPLKTTTGRNDRCEHERPQDSRRTPRARGSSELETRITSFAGVREDHHPGSDWLSG